MTLPATPSVLIVGAGPTGLTLAACLQRYGIPVRLIEKKPGLSRSTKATNLMQRSQEILHALDLLGPINEISGLMRRIMVHAYGKCFGACTMRLKETPFQDVILCGQHRFEAVMAGGLQKRGVPIEFDTELMRLEQTGHSVTAELKSRSGIERPTFSYAVGCDGGNGRTRAFTRYDFAPTKTGVGLRQVDAKLTWKRLSSMEQMWLFYFDRGFSAIVPLPGGVHRLITVEPKDQMPEREPTLAEMESRLRVIVQDDSLTLSDLEWTSYSDLSMGLARGLRDGRILLAGDVGNPILPNGGQGMNTGIGDAFNLGWKLATALKSSPAAAVLDTYEVERHALRTALEKAQFNSLKYTTLVTPPLMQYLFRFVAEPALRWGGEYKMAQAFSQLAIHTRKSPLTLEAGGKRGLQAGDRALDADVCLGTKSIKLYDLIYRGGWTLFAFAGTNPKRLLSVGLALEQWLRNDIPTYVISTSSAAKMPCATLYDLDEVAHRVYQLREPMLYLIRPDGHVGARARPSDGPLIIEYAAKWIPKGLGSLSHSD